MKRHDALIFILVFFVSCRQTTSTTKDKAHNSKDTVSYLDTTIFLDQTISPAFTKELTPNEGKKLIYKYFKAKNIINEDDLKESPGVENQLVVRFDTIYNFRTDHMQGTVISYWMGEGDLNGHCFQPKKGLIQLTDDGYKLTKENFLPTSYTIDSSKESLLYGYEYECGGRGIIRKFKVTLR